MLNSSKSALRTLIRRKTRSLPANLVETHSGAAARLLFETDEWHRATCVSLYLPLPKGEIQTWDILHRSLQDKKKTFLPRVTGSSPRDMEMLQVFDLSELPYFETSKWGILEPPLYLCDYSSTSPDASVESDVESSKRMLPRPTIFDQGLMEDHLIIVPGVAFDRYGGRVGQGKGYYDYFLSTFTSQRILGSASPPNVIGFAFDEQVMESEAVPMDDNDFYLDKVVTPSRVYTVVRKTDEYRFLEGEADQLQQTA